MRREIEIETVPAPKAVALPADLDRIMWNIPLFLALATVTAALIRLL